MMAVRWLVVTLNLGGAERRSHRTATATTAQHIEVGNFYSVTPSSLTTTRSGERSFSLLANLTDRVYGDARCGK